jgi:hypothetical protein
MNPSKEILPAITSHSFSAGVLNGGYSNFLSHVSYIGISTMLEKIESTPSLKINLRKFGIDAIV